MTEFLTPEEVAAATHVSVETLAQRRYQGLPPAFHKPTPRTVLYRRDDIDSWLEQSRQTITTKAAVA